MKLAVFALCMFTGCATTTAPQRRVMTNNEEFANAPPTFIFTEAIRLNRDQTIVCTYLAKRNGFFCQTPQEFLAMQSKNP